MCVCDVFASSVTQEFVLCSYTLICVFFSCVFCIQSKVVPISTSHVCVILHTSLPTPPAVLDIKPTKQRKYGSTEEACFSC